jgi:hypothetical protein
MKSPLRLGLLVGIFATILAVVTGVATWSLLGLGSTTLALTVAVAGIAAVAVVGVAWSLARDAEQQLQELLPPLPVEPVAPAVAASLGKRGFRVREARPGEVPEAYLAAVRKGAQARQAAWRASEVHPPSPQ